MYWLYRAIPNRDIVDIVYRLLHKDCLTKLNDEYKSKVKDEFPTGTSGIIVMVSPYKSIFYNYRIFLHSREGYIYRIQKHLTYPVIVARISKNY